MEPRLKNSKKWTALPEEFLKQVQSVFNESFAKEIGKGTIEVQGKIFPEEILVRVSYKAPKALKQKGFDISVAYKVPKDNVLKLLHLAVDAGASLMEQMFASEDETEFAVLWEEVQFENRTIYVRFNTANNKLESEANRLLGLAEGEDLAEGDWDDDAEPDEIKARLGIDPDEDDTDEDGKGSTEH